MWDIKELMRDPKAARLALERRGFALDVERLERLWKEEKEALMAFEAAQQQRGRIAKEAARAGDPTTARQAGLQAKEGIERVRARHQEAREALRQELLRIPAAPLKEVPDGMDETGNQVRYRNREPEPLGFKPLTHDELGRLHEGIDFEAGARLAGARSAVLRGGIARLHRALGQMMLDDHIEAGFEEVQTPFMVRPEALIGTGQLPKFEEELFKMERDGLYLIPTAEVTVTNLLAGERVEQDRLPMRMVCQTACFRREAGAAGRDVKGLIRQHQFEKVELVVACHPDQARAEHERLIERARRPLELLELPFQELQLCAGDMGFAARSTVDLEVWLPGQGAWREISSVSDFGDFQARRMNARFIDEQGKGRFLATLNGSGLAIGRALVAVMENCQTADGAIVVPKALRPWMGGLEILEPPRARKPGPRM